MSIACWWCPAALGENRWVASNIIVLVRKQFRWLFKPICYMMWSISRFLHCRTEPTWRIHISRFISVPTYTGIRVAMSTRRNNGCSLRKLQNACHFHCPLSLYYILRRRWLFQTGLLSETIRRARLELSPFARFESCCGLILPWMSEAYTAMYFVDDEKTPVNISRRSAEWHSCPAETAGFLIWHLLYPHTLISISVFLNTLNEARWLQTNILH